MALSAILLERTDNTFVISAFDTDGIVVSALDDTFYPIMWQPYVRSSQLWTKYTNLPNYDILDSSTGSAIDTGVPYGSAIYATSGSYISGVVFVDSQPFTVFVSAVSTDGFGGVDSIAEQITASVDFIPWRIAILSEEPTLTSASLCAFFVDGNDTYYSLYSSMCADWDVSPTTNLTALSVGGDEYPFITASVTDISGLTIFSDSTATDFTYNLTFIPLCADAWRSNASYTFGVNPRIEYSLTQNQVCALSQAFLQKAGQKELSDDFDVVWVLDTIEGLSSTVMTASGPSALDFQIGPAPAGELATLTLRATSYDQVYTIGISGGEASGGIFYGTKFIPYLDFEFDSTPFIQAFPIIEGNQIKDYRLNFQFLSSNGIAHNINPDYPIVWDDEGNSQVDGFQQSLTGQGYDFLSDGGSLNLYRTFNPLFLGISSTVWDQVGSPGVETFNITVTATSGYTIPDDTLSIATTSITAMNFIPDAVFDPIFSLNNELTSTNEIYRKVSNPYTLTIRDSSIVPSGLSLDNFTFEFSTGDSILTASEFLLVSSLAIDSEQTLEISLTGEIAKSDWPASSRKTTTSKFINFVSFFPVASSFVIYPARKWDIGTSQFVDVSSSPFTESEGVCAYGYCHTEKFYLSSAFWPASASYFWGIEGITPNPLGDSSREISKDIPSTASTRTHSVSLFISTSSLPETMERFHRSDSDGSIVSYPNFSDTSESTGLDIDTTFRNFINRPTFSNFGSADIDLRYNPVGVTAVPLILSGIISVPSDLPLKQGNTNSLTWNISTANWNYVYSDTSSSYTVNFTVVDVPTADNAIPLFEPTLVYVSLELNNVLVTRDNIYNDWCTTSVGYSSVTEVVTAYPTNPIIYTNNRFVLTGTEVIYQNLVPYFNDLSGFKWEDSEHDDFYFTTTNSNYITSYSETGRKSVTLTTDYSGLFTDTKTFSNITRVLGYFELFDEDVDRVIGVTTLSLPNSRQICRTPSNEFTTADNVNRSFEKMNENLNYLSLQSKVYASPPSQYFGWYGALENWRGDLENRWRVNIDNLDVNYLTPSAADVGLISNGRDISVRKVTGQGDNITLISNTTSVIMLSSDFFGTEIGRITQKGIGDEFASIEAIDTDLNFATQQRVYVLDSLKNRVLVYEYNFTSSEFKLLYSWGGIGGPGARNKFNKPNDLLVDSNNVLWVTDRDNKVVKKFSRTGSWISTYGSDFFTDQNKPRSTAIGDDGSVHILADRSIVKINPSTLEETEYAKNILAGLNPKTITTSKDGGYFYILANDRVLKITQKGIVAGIFGDEFGITTYRNLYHDDNRNLYLIFDKGIVKYVDKLEPLELTLDTMGKTWPLSAIFVDPEEYIQDWVVNKGIARFYDNLEVFRRSIIGKYTTTLQNGILVPVIRSFTPTEYTELPYRKSDIYIGLNEIVSTDVFNRCIDKLYSCIEVLKNLIEE